MKRIVLTCAALLLSGQALADSYANANTQIKMGICAAEQCKAADAEPNETYQNVLKRAAPTQRDSLKKAQASRITLCDADCTLISLGTGGSSVQTVTSSQYLTDRTNEREAFLALLLQCEEDDLNYPLPLASQRTRVPSIVTHHMSSTV